MGESGRRQAALSTIVSERSCALCKFGTVVRALWPHKPALNLAQRMGVSERNALQIIRGERRVTARAVVVVNIEMLEIYRPRPNSRSGLRTARLSER